MHPPQPHQPYQVVFVKQRGFNPVTFGVHLALWVFLHWWLILLSVGVWLLVAVPVSFLGWKVKRAVPFIPPPQHS